MKKQWYQYRWVQTGLHGTFWVLFFLLPYLLQPSFQDDDPSPRRVRQTDLFFYFNLVKCLFWMGLFYFNAYVLVPRLLYRRKYLLYTGSILLILAVLGVLEFFYFASPRHHASGFYVRGFALYNLFPFLFILAGSTAFRSIADKNREERRKKERLAENLKSELSFLRSQMSPHFMFNVINNIVALARKKSDLVEPSLIKLSSLMRYFLYEHETDTVSLQKEIEYLQSYIDLQQQRFGKNTIVEMKVGEIDADYQIEPMLLIPFVENAFKHGIMPKGSIDIALSAVNGLLHFSVVNPYLEREGEVKDRTSGIGLANVERRLDLLYEHRHELTIKKEDGWFRVSLQLKLH